MTNLGKLSTRTRMHDDVPMPFGKYKGQRMGDVPDSYWRWFLAQEWSRQWPDVVAYANLIEEDR